MDSGVVATPALVARPLRLEPFRAMSLSPRRIGAQASARAFARPYREVAARFAGTPSAQAAETRRADLACQTAAATSGLGAADPAADAGLDAGLDPDPAAASADADGG